MKIRDGKGNLLIFDDEDETIRHEFANLFFEVRNNFMNGKIDLPYHERNLCKIFKEKYNLEFSVEEMLEVRDYYDNYYSIDVEDKIRQDQQKGMTKIDLKKMGLE